ncbi:hypothetical protein EJB05_18066 [Eragrostis curvula]|uniref:DUF6598 domain-containing protein n=1 Tax=Eragrostis curvula TaxID=38414 RepID=A0A5J9VIU9_9POAL|nr:hypothetical protein EJB05_18066 [Eragrostis curvula]
MGYPINVHGTVIIRDRLDLKCIYIFRRNRDNCQLVQSKGESLILTGPTRGVGFSYQAYCEINLKIKDTQTQDKQFSKVLFQMDTYEFYSLVDSKTVASWLSEVDLVLAHVKKSFEGTIQITILSGPEAFDGKITACTTDVPNHHILLYDSAVNGANILSDDRVFQLLRRVVAVSEDQMLVFNIRACSGGQNDISHRSCKLTPLTRGRNMVEVICGLYKMRIELVACEL